MRLRRWQSALLTVMTSLPLLTAIPSAAHADDANGTTTVVPFDPNEGQFPESITTDQNGNIYFPGSGGRIWTVIPDGRHQPVLFATVPLPQASPPDVSVLVGVKVGKDGYLYTVSGGSSPSLDASRVWRISPSGDVQEYAHLDPNGKPNDLAFDDAGNLYVTDSGLGEVWKIGPGGDAAGATPAVWLSDPLLAPNPSDPGAPGGLAFGANGIAFDAGKKNLYVDNFDNGQIIKIPVDTSGQPGEATVFASDPRLKGADGLAFDARGTLYAAVNPQNQIATVSSTGTVNVLASGPIFDTPSSMVFSSQDGDSQSGTLYIANYALQELLNGVTPHPSLLQMSVEVGGLPLP